MLQPSSSKTSSPPPPPPPAASAGGAEEEEEEEAVKKLGGFSREEDGKGAKFAMGAQLGRFTGRRWEMGRGEGEGKHPGKAETRRREKEERERVKEEKFMGEEKKKCGEGKKEKNRGGRKTSDSGGAALLFGGIKTPPFLHLFHHLISFSFHLTFSIISHQNKKRVQLFRHFFFIKYQD